MKPFPSEVITVFLKSPNETRTSTIKFGEDISEYTFQSGTSIEVHIYCCITSHWLIATEVKIYGNKKLDQGDFKINWRPLKGANMSSNAFCMHFEETVKQFIDLRDQSLWKAIELSEKPPIKSSWSKHNLKENYCFFLFFFLYDTNFSWYFNGHCSGKDTKWIQVKFLIKGAVNLWFMNEAWIQTQVW